MALITGGPWAKPYQMGLMADLFSTIILLAILCHLFRSHGLADNCRLDSLAATDLRLILVQTLRSPNMQK
jgi:hypothetical protein